MSQKDLMFASLEGLSVGDAFGETFFGPGSDVYPKIRARDLKAGPWPWTDDTEMALSIVAMLEKTGEIDQTALADAFAARMTYGRGYGLGTYQLLEGVRLGMGWRSLSLSGFRGVGSFGNGSAMRAAPLGAFFADDRERCLEQARLAAEVTHSHAEGIAGGVAVAVATAVAVKRKKADWREQLREIAEATPGKYVKEGILEASRLDDECSLVGAADALGNGSGVTSPDTVPYCLWVAFRRLDSYEEALWETVAAFGDRDTTCAIVGGILGARLGVEAIPAEWRARREKLPEL